MTKRKLISFDWAMKKILRQKSNFSILEGFLSELFKFDLKIEEVLESESNQETQADKFNRVDLLAKNTEGELILIEVQHDSETDYFHRMLYGTSKLISEYIQKGTGYHAVKKVYSVNIVYFDLGQGFDYLYHGKIDFKGMNRTDDQLNPSIKQKQAFSINTVSDIFPEYYIIKVNHFNDIARNSLDEWIYFLKNEEIKTQFHAKGLQKASETLDVLKLDKKARAIYQRQEENKMYKASLLYTAREEGIEKGRKEGRGEGINAEKIKIAKKLLRLNMEPVFISETTGLSLDEIKNL